MEKFVNILKFIIYISLSFFILLVLYAGIWWFAFFLFDVYWVWAILLIVFGYVFIIWISVLLPLFIGSFISNLNTFKNIAKWITVPIGIIMVILNIYILWSVIPLGHPKSFPILIVTSILIILVSTTYLIGINSDD